MRPNIDFQGLLTMIKNNEDAHRFNLGRWIEDCGTYGCLVGNFCLANVHDKLHILKNNDNKDVYQLVANRFGITRNEAWYLFAMREPTKISSKGITKYRYPGKIGNNMQEIRDCFDETTIGKYRETSNKQSAINRLRKFVYYHMKKREFCLDDKGITEKSRQIGHVNFNKKVKELVGV